jgi:hypothetical protein
LASASENVALLVELYSQQSPVRLYVKLVHGVPSSRHAVVHRMAHSNLTINELVKLVISALSSPFTKFVSLNRDNGAHVVVEVDVAVVDVDDDDVVVDTVDDVDVPELVLEVVAVNDVALEVVVLEVVVLVVLVDDEEVVVVVTVVVVLVCPMHSCRIR